VLFSASSQDGVAKPIDYDFYFGVLLESGGIQLEMLLVMLSYTSM
jgi:hypothetical protein